MYADIDDFVGRERRFHQSGRESLPFDILHGDEETIPVLIHLIDRADVRMIQCGRGPCFTEQPFFGLRIVDRFRRQHFDRDFAFQLGVLRKEDFAHAA